MNILSNSINKQISNAIAEGLAAGVFLIVIGFAVSIAIFALYVAVATIVIKKIWYSDIGGRPGNYR